LTRGKAQINYFHLLETEHPHTHIAEYLCKTVEKIQHINGIKNTYSTAMTAQATNFLSTSMVNRKHAVVFGSSLHLNSSDY